MDPEFVEQINAQFLCLTIANLCHALHCWQTGVFNDEFHFIRTNSRDKLPLISVCRENLVIC